MNRNNVPANGLLNKSKSHTKKGPGRRHWQGGASQREAA